MTSPSRLTALAELVLTSDPAKRPHMNMWLTSAATYLLYTGLMWLQVWLGYAPARATAWLSLGSLVVNVGFYFGFRLSQGRQQDRTLGTAQLLVGIAFLWMSYAVSGPASSTMLIIVASHIVYAMFGLTARHLWQLVAFSLTGLALTMIACNAWQPERYPAGLQLLSFLYTFLVVVVLISRLATLVAKMNDGLRSQRRELAAALDRVRELATRDDLTQVHNRRHITELMRIEQTQHERSGSPLCLAVLDIDFFKVVNDNHGHHAGDEVLRRFAQAAQQVLRASDLLGRWGGEEFVVLFPDTPIEQAQVALQRVREQLRATDFSGVAPGARITFSAGVVEVMPQERIEASIARADQAMYRAKTNGRDRIEPDISHTIAERNVTEKAARRA